LSVTGLRYHQRGKNPKSKRKIATPRLPPF